MGFTFVKFSDLFNVFHKLQHIYRYMWFWNNEFI